MGNQIMLQCFTNFHIIDEGDDDMKENPIVVGAIPHSVYHGVGGMSKPISKTNRTDSEFLFIIKGIIG